MTNINLYIIGALVAAVLGLSVFAWYQSTEHKSYVDSVTIERLEEKNAYLEKVKVLSDNLNNRKVEIEQDYTAATDRIDALVNRLDGIRLQDKRSNTPATGTTSGTIGDATTIEGGVVLHEQTSADLLNLTREADYTLEELRVCRGWHDAVQEEYRKFHER